eukprot:CAMPEP_0178428028 /NCGR_PEP_ID=MMETSP0689_2-20121128/30059_1 /TAXON_ID=160604 /ORGANISM="Amphidinium massartii, Strain CS-259" /LENGTH=111 /DNA_ID=CAMNT_0020049773 /DNA_START=81 /DNA_END=417 /DNA_ORIENTATION=+
MMLPFLPKPPPKEYFTPKQRAIGRVVLFVTSIIAIVQLGDTFEMPENPKFAELHHHHRGMLAAVGAACLAHSMIGGARTETPVVPSESMEGLVRPGKVVLERGAATKTAVS